MTQPALFDHVPPAPTLPYQGNSVEALVAGAEAADHARGRRPRLIERYLAHLLGKGAAQIAPHGHRQGPYGERNTVFALRIAIGLRLDGRGNA